MDETDLPVCLSMSNIFAWNTGSTASTETPVPEGGQNRLERQSTSLATVDRIIAFVTLYIIPDCGIAKTSMTRTVYSSTNSPSMRPITSIGTPKTKVNGKIPINYLHVCLFFWDA